MEVKGPEDQSAALADQLLTGEIKEGKLISEGKAEFRPMFLSSDDTLQSHPGQHLRAGPHPAISLSAAWGEARLPILVLSLSGRV